MYLLLVTLILGLFVAMLFLNLYFRMKVLQVYKVLVQNDIEFGASHIFNKEKMEKEILPRYPKHRKEIETFVSHIQYSIRMASVLVLLITLFGAVLMFYR